MQFEVGGGGGGDSEYNGISFPIMVATLARQICLFSLCGCLELSDY